MPHEEGHEPSAQDIVDWISTTLKLPWAKTPTTTSTRSETADYIADAGPIGQILNSLGVTKFQSIGFGVSDFVYDSWKRLAESPNPDGGYLSKYVPGAPDDGGVLNIAGWTRGKAQRDLIDFWEDQLLENNVPQSNMVEFREAREAYTKNPTIDTYQAVQNKANNVLDYAISPTKLQSATADAINELIPMLESAPDLGAKRAEKLKNDLNNARSLEELNKAVEETKTVIRTNVPGENWTDDFRASEAERTKPGETYKPGDKYFKPSDAFVQGGLDELGGATAFGSEYSNTGPRGKFTEQVAPDLVAESIATLTGPDGWPVRLQSGNVLLYRGSLPDGSPMLLGEFDWDEEAQEMVKVGTGSAADPTAIRTSLFEAADGTQRLINSDTGALIKDLGQGFAAMDSTRNFDQRASQFGTTEDRLNAEFNATFGLQQQQFGEGVRQFDTRFGEDVRQFDLGFGENVRQFDVGFGEDQRQFNLGFGENQRQFGTQEDRMERTLAANNYFSSLEELGRNYRTFVQTSPDLANAATNQGELIRNILTNGGDVLARTYFTRGGISPLPEITQADLINNLNDEMQKIQTFEQQGIQAENARRARADMERARGEYNQFAEFQQQTPQFTTRQIFDDTGFGTAQTEYQQSLQDFADDAGGWRANDEAALAAHTAAGSGAAANAAVAALPADATPEMKGIAVQQAQTDYANETARLQGQVASHTPMGPGRAQFTETIREQIPVPTFQSWAQSQGPSFAPTPQLNVPNVPTPQRTSQGQLIAQSRATTPPAVASVLSGQMPTPLQFGGLPLPTFQQLQALTPTEQEMLNSRLMTEFNVPLSDVAFQSQRQFGTPSMERNRDLARFRGYAV